MLYIIYMQKQIMPFNRSIRPLVHAFCCE